MARARRADEPDNPYGALGLREDATAEEVKERYRELALRHHPDRDGSDGSRFREARQAYEAIVGGTPRAKIRDEPRAGPQRRNPQYIEMVPVTSSNLVAAGYDRQTGTLRVEFKRGVYDYYGVPESVYLGLLSAESVGSYHARHIKWEYAYAQIGRK